MNTQESYSDEYISAYIDGELDSEERARLLYDEQTDKMLAQRINQTRMLKEKIKLTYADVRNSKDEKKSFSCSALVTRYRALAASLLIVSTAAILAYNVSDNDSILLAKQLIKNTQPIAVNSMNNVIGDKHRVIINLSQYQPQTFNDTVRNIEALLQSRKNTPFMVEILANGQGLKALDRDASLHAEKIRLLAKQFDNLEVVACARSLVKLAADGDPIELMKSIMITPSAASQVAKRTAAGWLYLKI